MVKCKCGYENDDEAKFCSNCGETIEVSCPKCGAKLDKQSLFCYSCGCNLQETKKEAVGMKGNVIAGDVDNSQHTSIVTNIYHQGPALDELDVVCKTCGKAILASAKRMFQCHKCSGYFCFDHMDVQNHICLECRAQQELSAFEVARHENGKFSILKLKSSSDMIVVVPSSVESIENDAFANSSVMEVHLNEGLLKIGERAFANCEDLDTINFPNSLRVISKDAFAGCVNLNIRKLPNIRIHPSAFSKGTKTDVTGSDNLQPPDTTGACNVSTDRCVNREQSNVKVHKSIDNSIPQVQSKEMTASNTTYLTSFCDENIVDGTILKKYKGKNRKVTIPNGITGIGEGAFSGCVDLITVRIPDSVTFIDAGAFRGCVNLSTVRMSEALSSIEKHAFAGCKSLSNISFPKELRSIGDSAFVECINLPALEIPHGTISIGENAFKHCAKLVEVVVPETTTKIGLKAFEGCSSLVSVWLPKKILSRNLDDLKSDIFSDCKKLKNLKMSGNRK